MPSSRQPAVEKVWPWLTQILSHASRDAWWQDLSVIRARYRNSLAEPEPLTPGEPARLSLDLSVTSNVFLAGHRIRLEVSSSNFPRFDRNTNTGGVIADETADQATVAVNRVLHGPDHPSLLILPVISRTT
jgi:hypothetical protein